MRREQNQEMTPLTYLMSLLHSEVGRYRRRPDGSSYIILAAEWHFLEFLDPDSQVNRDRQKPPSHDLCFQVLQDQACSITINIREGERPTVVMWPTYSEELPDELIIRKSWDESEIVFKIAELADIYWGQRDMSDEELGQESVFFNIPSRGRDRQTLEEQLTAAGYGPQVKRQVMKPAGRRPARRTQQRSRVLGKPAKRKRPAQTKVSG